MNLFWNIYKNLENELVDLSNNIYFSDDQEKVYSLRISDLLIRVSVEIEAISKELYKIAGGDMTPLGNNGEQRKLFFDTDCIQFLDLKWKITKKVVNVVSPNFFFKKNENVTLRPLKDCNKAGKGRWKKAYQAVKHDRVGSIADGNVGNLIRAMAALYVLNIYYRNESYMVGTVMNSVPFDNSMGSSVFSVMVAHADECHYSERMGDHSILQHVKDNLSSAVLIRKFTDDTFELAHKAMLDYEKEAIERLAHEPQVLNFLQANPQYKVKSLLSLANDAGGDQLVSKVLMGQKVVSDLPKYNLEVILNKGQQIYPELGEA